MNGRHAIRRGSASAGALPDSAIVAGIPELPKCEPFTRALSSLAGYCLREHRMEERIKLKGGSERLAKQPESRRWSKLAVLALAAAMALVLFVVVSRAQNAASVAGAKKDANSGDLVYQCPMDHDGRSNKPGVCARCGMKLVTGIPEPQEFPVNLSVTPRLLRPGARAQLLFSIRDPDNGRPAEHDGKFRYNIKFPRTGMYRILSDFYPEGATPQLIAKTVIVPRPAQAPPLLSRDYATRATENLSLSLVTDPPQPIAGTKTMLFFRLDPIHTHPFIADGGPGMRFNIYFPRAQTYRTWLQINTARFDVPVKDLE
jgi:hypothetical protein